MLLSLLAVRIRNWLHRRRLRRYALRSATERDLDFIMEEVIEGAKHEHYAPSLLDPAQARAFRDQLTNVIRHTVMLRGTDRGPEQIRAWLYVYGCNGDDQVGYLLISEKRPGSLGTDIELYEVGIRKDRRSEGHGRRIIQLFVAASPPSAKLYARCYPQSETMFKLLLALGFSHIRTMPLGTRELEMCIREA
jgi:hypothetical protein